MIFRPLHRQAGRAESCRESRRNSTSRHNLLFATSISEAVIPRSNNDPFAVVREGARSLECAKRLPNLQMGIISVSWLLNENHENRLRMSQFRAQPLGKETRQGLETSRRGLTPEPPLGNPQTRRAYREARSPPFDCCT